MRSWELAYQQAFDGAASGQPPSEQPRGEDLGVVEDQQIAWLEEIREPREGCVFEASRLAVEHEQARRASHRGRLLRD